jgi:hypothetical protein
MVTKYTMFIHHFQGHLSLEALNTGKSSEHDHMAMRAMENTYCIDA